MTDRKTLPPAAAEITEELVASLGGIANLNFPVERLPVIAQRLREMHILAGDLENLDLDDSEPAIRFDPAWPEGVRS